MKGYFSKIAKQSGLRFPGQGAGARQAAAGEPEIISSPLHREETVMVPPIVSETRAESRGKAKPENPAVNNELRPQAKASDVERPSPKHPLAVKEDVPASPPVTEKVEPWHAKTVEPRSTEAPEDNADDGAQKVSPPEFRPLEQVILKEVAQPSEDEEAVPLAETVAVPESRHAEQPETKQFFTKTAEAIDKGEASPQELHTILLREVQQWVADQPETPADSTAFDIPSIEMEETVVKETPVRRIGQPRIKEMRTEPLVSKPEQNQIAEQNFELSIGTISVVIEDEQKPVHAEPQQQPRQDTRTAAPGSARSSRLRRSYI